jgi:hypothetical protein
MRQPANRVIDIYTDDLHRSATVLTHTPRTVPEDGRRRADRGLAIEEPQLIAKILSHLERAAAEQSQSELPLVARGPPVQSSLL